MSVRISSRCSGDERLPSMPLIQWALYLTFGAKPSGISAVTAAGDLVLGNRTGKLIDVNEEWILGFDAGISTSKPSRSSAGTIKSRRLLLSVGHSMQHASAQRTAASQTFYHLHSHFQIEVCICCLYCDDR